MMGGDFLQDDCAAELAARHTRLPLPLRRAISDSRQEISVNTRLKVFTTPAFSKKKNMLARFISRCASATIFLERAKR